MVFRIDKATAQTHYKRALKQKLKVGRPSCLTQEQKDRLLAYIQSQFYENRPVSYAEILSFLDLEYSIQMKLNTLNHMMHSIKGIRVIQGRPMESERVQFDQQSLIQYFQQAKIYIDNIPAALLFNMDESGFADWQDATMVKVIVPSSYVQDFINIPVKRATRRTTLVATIAADGTYLKPLIILPRKTIDSELYSFGLTPDKTMFGYQENGFISAQIFWQWAEEIFFPAVMERRERLQYCGWAVLLLDGCSCHDSDRFLDACLARRVMPIFLPPHTSDQTQPLDLLLFALTKRNMRFQSIGNGFSQQTMAVVRMLSAFQSSATTLNIIKSFERAGFFTIYSSERRCNLMRVHPNFASLTPYAVQARAPGD